MASEDSHYAGRAGADDGPRGISERASKGAEGREARRRRTDVRPSSPEPDSCEVGSDLTPSLDSAACPSQRVGRLAPVVNQLQPFYWPEVCLYPARCGRWRRCLVEQRMLNKGEDLGALHAPPCFLSLLRSLEEVETARRALQRSDQGLPEWGNDAGA